MTKHGDNGLTCILHFSDIPEEGYKFSLKATAQEQIDLAARIGVEEIADLGANISLVPIKLTPGEFHLCGNLTARVIQPCVITLDPLTQEINEPLDIIFTHDEEKVKEPLQEHLADLDGPIFELIEDDKLDLGEILEQYLAVSIDMYPKRSDAPQSLSGEGWTFTADESLGRKAFANLDSLMASSPKKSK